MQVVVMAVCKFEHRGFKKAKGRMLKKKCKPVGQKTSRAVKLKIS
jgi:hypothetical protein